MCMCACNSHARVSIMHSMCSLQCSRPRKLLIKTSQPFSLPRRKVVRRYEDSPSSCHILFMSRGFIFWKAFSMGLVPSIWGIREYIALNTKILPASWDSDNLQKKRAARNPIIAPQAQLLAPQTLSVCQRWQDTLIVS